MMTSASSQRREVMIYDQGLGSWVWGRADLTRRFEGAGFEGVRRGDLAVGLPERRGAFGAEIFPRALAALLAVVPKLRPHARAVGTMIPAPQHGAVGAPERF